ncbi:MAG: carboxylesterase [Gammaproteobacteria bacterium]|nr:carboxylesterase [Gammaproteobacteria bacterium]
MQHTKTFLRDTVTVEPSNKARAAVILLHGLGADAGDLSELARHLQLPCDSVRFVFPNAPLLPVSINGGMLMPAWFDILGLTANSKQDKEGILKAKDHIELLIHEENERGIPYEKIYLGGFSQGGALALFAGLHCSKRLGGVIGLSTYLPIADSLSPLHQMLPIFLGHGTHDQVVPFAWGELAAQQLRGFGCEVNWCTFSAEHTITIEEVEKLREWLRGSIS